MGSRTRIRSATNRSSHPTANSSAAPTSGYYGHCLRKSLAIGYVKPEYAAVGTALMVEVLGERKRATVLVDSPYDPQNLELRA